MPKLNDMITADRVRFLLSYNPATGELLWRNPTSHKQHVGHAAGAMGSNGRRYIGIDRVRYLAHRIVWLYVHGELPRENIAPKNGDHGDLRLENLTLETAAQTARKATKPRSSSASGTRGVIWSEAKKKWRAEITRNYQNTFLGYFTSKEEAQAAYDAAVRGEYPHTGDPMLQRVRAARRQREGELRRVWRKLLRDYDSLGWESFSEFADTVGITPGPRYTMAPKNKKKPIGPTNYTWESEQLFDRKTAEGRLAYSREHRAQNRDYYKDVELRRAFGMGLERYREMDAGQEGLCAICKRPETDVRRGKLQTLSVDHCHKTGVVRDLLCAACNKGIGYFRDTPSLLRAAADYLERHAAKSSPADAGEAIASNVVQLKKPKSG